MDVNGDWSAMADRVAETEGSMGKRAVGSGCTGPVDVLSHSLTLMPVLRVGTTGAELKRVNVGGAVCGASCEGTTASTGELRTGKLVLWIADTGTIMA
jgi:hypothetical protein